MQTLIRTRLACSCTSWPKVQGSMQCSDRLPSRGRGPRRQPAPAHSLGSEHTWPAKVRHTTHLSSQSQTTLGQREEPDVQCTEVYLDVIYSKVAAGCQHWAAILEVPLSQLLADVVEETAGRRGFHHKAGWKVKVMVTLNLTGLVFITC